MTFNPLSPPANYSFSSTFGDYTLRNKLGAGGNGIVYEVEVSNTTGKNCQLPQKCAIKFFHPIHENNDYERKERFERFKQEIRIAKEIEGKIEGVMPILDFQYGEGCDELAWYLMPKATPYSFNKPFDTCVIDMITLCESIGRLHECGYEHRDIKPANLLTLGRRLLLSDLGLCFDEKSEINITGSNEVLGPSYIRPPELERHRNTKNIDYKKTDVYLFAKTAWIVFTKSIKGFRGEYNRKDPQIFLDKFKFGVKTLEPLHLMMEKATKSNYLDRIDIKDCLAYLRTQKAIIDETIDETMVNEFLSEEVLGFAYSLDPDEKSFKNPHSMLQVLKKLSDYAFSVGISDFRKNYYLGKYSFVEEMADKNIYRLSLYDERLGCNKILIIQAVEVKLSSRKSVIKTSQFQHAVGEVKECFSVQDVINNNDESLQLVLQGAFTLILSNVFSPEDY